MQAGFQWADGERPWDMGMAIGGGARGGPTRSASGLRGTQSVREVGLAMGLHELDKPKKERTWTSHKARTGAQGGKTRPVSGTLGMDTESQGNDGTSIPWMES